MSIGKMKNIDFINEIEKLKKDKNIILLAHFYQTPDIQDIADFVGDSLALAQKASAADASIIVIAGVKFMAETAKLLVPDKKVLIPDINAGCSLADSCPPEEFKKFIEENPGRTVVSYVNTSVEIKAMSDIICTSTNAVKIIESLPEDEKIIFAPDRNLGNYIKNKINRDILVWDGACHVHEKFSVEGIIKLKEKYRDAKIIVHPECELPVRMIADFIGSTSALLNFTKNDNSETYIVATEPGLLHQMIKANPNKKYIPAPPSDPLCACSECNYMKMITIEKIYNTMLIEEPEIIIDNDLIKRAAKPVFKMFELSSKPGF